MSRLAGRLSIVVLIGLVGAVLAAGPAAAKLPRTYTSQSIDSPSPTAGGDFGIAFVNGGGPNAHGKEDPNVGAHENGGSTGADFRNNGAARTEIRAVASPDP